VLQLLADNPYIIMDEHFEGNEDRTEEPEAGVGVKVWGNVVAFVERLDDEHFKSLQVSDVTCTSRKHIQQWHVSIGKLACKSVKVSAAYAVASAEHLDKWHFKSLQVRPLKSL
jgi:hypothetical protein